MLLYKNDPQRILDCVFAAAAAAPKRCLFIQPFNTFSEMGARKSRVVLAASSGITILAEVSTTITRSAERAGEDQEF